VPASYANASAAYPPLAQGPAYPGSSAAYTPQAHGAYPPMGQTLSHLPLMADPMGDMRAAGHMMMGGGAGGMVPGMQAPVSQLFRYLLFI
jgi:hypothetical protein